MLPGARLGAAPWHLGMLASALCIFDIFRGRYDATDAYKSRSIKVTAEHVERGARLLNVLHMIKDIAVGTDKPAAEVSACEQDIEMRRAEIVQRLLLPDETHAALWTQDRFASFSGDAPASADRLADDAGFADGDDTDAEHLASASPLVVGGAPSLGLAGALAETGTPPPAAVAPKVLTEKEVRSVDYGYGLGGKSVQEVLHCPGLTDRAIMKKTLLVGTPSIGFKVTGGLTRHARGSLTLIVNAKLPIPEGGRMREEGGR